MNRIENVSSVVPELANCGGISSGLTSTSSGAQAVGCTPGNWINCCWYPPLYYFAPPIDYDLLADKIADRIKGTKERSKEEIRKEINKLLSELEKAK